MRLQTMARRPLLWAALAGGLLAAGAVQAADDSMFAQSRVELRMQETRPWTPEEMRAATPYPLDREGTPSRAPADALARMTEGRPGLVNGGLPEGVPTSRLESIETRSGFAAEPLASEVETLGYAYPGPFSRYEVFPNYTTYPFRTVGKLFFKQYGTSYVCSASSIGNYAIWTAGHCVHAGDGSGQAGFSTNVVFVPAYKNGAAPYGQWTAAGAWVATAFATSGTPDYDFGGFVLKAKGGKKISQKVGWLGFAWNLGVNQHWFVVGYPAAPPFSGGTMQNCAASYAYSDGTFSPAPSGVGCDLTGGISGGPWVMALSAAGGYLNGQSTYRYLGNTQEIYSPYFGDHARGLHLCLVNSTPTVPKCN